MAGNTLDQAREVMGKVKILSDWWRDTADAEIDMVCAKAIEYGATDLRDLGRMIYQMAGRPEPDDTVATEVGIAFYALGKMSRIVAAIGEGRTPSADTWLDLGVYARMAQRVRQVGGWPGIDPVPAAPGLWVSQATAGHDPEPPF